MPTPTLLPFLRRIRTLGTRGWQCAQLQAYLSISLGVSYGHVTVLWPVRCKWPERTAWEKMPFPPPGALLGMDKQRAEGIWVLGDLVGPPLSALQPPEFLFHQRVD